MVAIAKKYPVDFVLGAKGEGATIAKVGATAAKIKGIAKQTADFGKSMTAALTLPIVAASGVSLKAFAGFQDQMADVETLIDSTTESIVDMGAQVVKVGKQVPVPYAELTSALYDVRSAGVAVSDQFEVLENSARLAVAGKGTTAQAVDLVTSSLNAFQLQGEEADRVYNTIFETVKFGKTTIEGLAQGFGATAGTVAAAGVKLDEYLSSVAALTTTGQPAAQAHTQLKAVISGLTRETKESVKVFGALGAKNLPQLIQLSGGLVPALAHIKAELGGDTAAMLKLVGSTEALNAMIGLTGAQAAVQKSTLLSMRSEVDALDTAFAKKQATASARIQVMKNSIEGSMIELGARLVPIVDKVTLAVDKATAWFAGLSDAQKDQVVQIGGVVAAAGPLLFALGATISAVQTLRLGTIALAGVKLLWRGVTLVTKGALLALKGMIWLGVTATRAMTGAVISSTSATSASVGPSYAAAGGFAAMVAPIVAVTGAIGALYLAWDRWNSLDKDLEGSGGTMATVGRAVENWDWNKGLSGNIFAAHDAVLNEKAIAAAQQRNVGGGANALPPALNAAAAVGGADVTRALQEAVAALKANAESGVKVRFEGMPKGFRAEAQGGIDMSMGYALGGT